MTTQVDDEKEVIRWRFDQLIIAGSDDHSAELISVRLDVSLHDAIALLEHKCSGPLMVAIML